MEVQKKKKKNPGKSNKSRHIISVGVDIGACPWEDGGTNRSNALNEAVVQLIIKNLMIKRTI